MIAQTLLTVLSLLMVASSLLANGFEYHDGYYWNDGQAYTRHKIQVRHYNGYGGYYYKDAYSYRKVPVIVKKEYVKEYVKDDYKEPEKVDYKDKGWRDRLLEIAAERDKYRQKQIESAQEHREYIEAVKVLGLQDVVDYPAAYGSSGYGYTQYKSIAEQGDTVYGYSYSTLADVYGDSDLAALYQQANRLAENAQGLAGEAQTGFQNLVEQEGSNRAKVAEILAKAQLLRSLDTPSRKTTTETRVYGSKPNSPPPPPPGPDAPELGPGGGLSQVIEKNCIGCHSSATASGKGDLFPDGVNMENYSSFSVPQKQAVVQSVFSGSMPKDADPLSTADSTLFFADLKATIESQSSN